MKRQNNIRGDIFLKRLYEYLLDRFDSLEYYKKEGEEEEENKRTGAPAGLDTFPPLLPNIIYGASAQRPPAHPCAGCFICSREEEGKKKIPSTTYVRTRIYKRRKRHKDHQITSLAGAATHTHRATPIIWYLSSRWYKFSTHLRKIVLPENLWGPTFRQVFYVPVWKCISEFEIDVRDRDVAVRRKRLVSSFLQIKKDNFITKL